MRYWFASDGDGHWYILPDSITREEFSDWVWDMEEDGVSDMDYSRHMLAMHPSNYTFTDPKRR